MKQNLLQEPNPNNVMLDNGTQVIEIKPNIIKDEVDEDKLNESLKEYER